MCGIAGFWDQSQGMSRDNLQAIATKMSKALVHRGPDHRGTWVDASAGIALGHRRLAILDLSPEGHQPMVSPGDRYIIVFNGEIYNFSELRQELGRLGHSFRGHSDTEVMLAALSQWGLNEGVKRFNGMFAFALWDREERALHLGRDRLGEKPLYYGWVGKTFFFASELKALKVHPDFKPEINRDALQLYLWHLYIPSPHSIYQGIYKLPAGCLLTLSSSQSTAQPVPYWSVKSAAESGVAGPFRGSEAEAIAQLDALLRDAVSLRMVADVPLGAFLSGGIDSSTVVALMQAVSSGPVKTFSIGVRDWKYNEAQYAKAVAQHLGTDHTELYVTPKETMAVIPKLPTLYDEPFCDSSQIPTFLVSQLARQQVTVSLSGDGGDELFYGYNRYFMAENIWQKMGWIPHNLRKAMSSALTSLSPQHWNRFLLTFPTILPNKLKQLKLGDKIYKLAELLKVRDRETLYLFLASLFWLWHDRDIVMVGSRELSPLSLTHLQPQAQLPDFRQQMMYLDMVTFLVDDILVKLDRASMGVSLESRVPLLDPRVVEFAWRIPLSMKIRNGQGKWLLRQVLDRYVPQKLVERPKSGFGIPIGSWLRGPLRDWAETLLDESRLEREGFFHPQPIRQKWAEFLADERKWAEDLWAILIFQTWLETVND